MNNTKLAVQSLSCALAAFSENEKALAMASAQALYSETFRSEPFDLSAGLISFDEAVELLMDVIYASSQSPRDDEPSFFWSDDDDGVSDYCEGEVVFSGYTREQAELLAPSVQFVELCNYKGEGEGWELFTRAQNLRVYHGKYNYN